MALAKEARATTQVLTLLDSFPRDQKFCKFPSLIPDLV